MASVLPRALFSCAGEHKSNLHLYSFNHFNLQFKFCLAHKQRAQTQVHVYKIHANKVFDDIIAPVIWFYAFVC